MNVIEAAIVALPPVQIPPCPAGYAISFYERDECGKGKNYKWYTESTASTMREVEETIGIHRELFGAIAFRVYQLPGGSANVER